MTLMRMTQFPDLWRELDGMFRDFRPVQSDDRRTFVPATDIVDTGTSVELHVDLPGVNPDAIDVKLDGRVLTISAERTLDRKDEKKGWVRVERASGRLERSFTIPETLDGSRPEASYRHGVLVVTLPKKEELKPRTLKVKVDA